MWPAGSQAFPGSFSTLMSLQLQPPRFPPPPSSGGALAVNSQGINRGRVVSAPSPQQCKLPRYIYIVWSWPRSPIQLRSVTSYKCHMYKEAGLLLHVVVGEARKHQELCGVTGPGSLRWRLEARGWQKGHRASLATERSVA